MLGQVHHHQMLRRCALKLSGRAVQVQLVQPRLCVQSRSFASKEGHEPKESGGGADWKRLKPDPNRVPNTRPPQYKEEITNDPMIDWRLYDQTTPANNISSVTANGFVLESGARIVSSPEAPKGLLLVGSDSYEVDLKDAVHNIETGRVEFDTAKVFGVFSVLYPKPELLVIGMGSKSRILGPNTHKYLRSLGFQTEIGTTVNSASSFDLLASERGGESVAGFLLPPNM